jgi:hypothetical protein
MVKSRLNTQPSSISRHDISASLSGTAGPYIPPNSQNIPRKDEQNRVYPRRCEASSPFGVKDKCRETQRGGNKRTVGRSCSMMGFPGSNRSLSKCFVGGPVNLCRFISVAFPLLSSLYSCETPITTATHCANFAAGRPEQRSRFLPQRKPGIILFIQDLIREFLSAPAAFVLMEIQHSFSTIPSVLRLTISQFFLRFSQYNVTVP